MKLLSERSLFYKRTLIVVFHPLVLSLCFSIAIIVLLPPMLNKYEAKTATVIKKEISSVYSYHDLNHDGNSEEIRYYRWTDYSPTFLVYTFGKIIDQWNFKGEYAGLDFFAYNDIDGDGSDEIILFNREQDSIFINMVHPFNIGMPPFYRKFIDVVHIAKNGYDAGIQFCDFPDADKDSIKEIVISIVSGLSKQPRNLYLIDIYNDTVLKSSQCGTGLFWPVAFDLDGDGHNEYTGETKAFGNFSSDSLFPYADLSAWLMVFNRNMKFVFDPIKFGQYKTLLDVAPFRIENKTYLAVFQRHQGIEDIKSMLFLFDGKGEKLNERDITNIGFSDNSFLVSNYSFNNLYLYNESKIYQVDSNLGFLKSFALKNIGSERPYGIDIDLDGEDEYVFLGEDNQSIMITRNDFRFPVKLNIPYDAGFACFYSVIKKKDARPQVCVSMGKDLIHFEYFENPLYRIRYLIWMGIYLSVFIFTYLLQRVQHFRAQTKYLAEKKLAELQLRTIKSQTDPHFTLNLIDSIGNLFYKQDTDKASYVFGKYARLLRTTILSSEKIAVKIEQELEYVKNYLDLEKFRYDNKFDYQIDETQINDKSIEIPKMLIHTFVENAVKHGIKHLESKGMIQINLKRVKNELVIEIQDNGVGRTKAAEYSRLSTGKGLQIADQMLSLFFELKKIRITYEIKDLFDSFSKASGTLITIKIPLK